MRWVVSLPFKLRNALDTLRSMLDLFFFVDGGHPYPRPCFHPLTLTLT